MYFPCGLFSGAVRIHAIYCGRYVYNYENATQFHGICTNIKPVSTVSTLSLKYIHIGRENMRWGKRHFIQFGYLNKVYLKKLRQLLRVSERNNITISTNFWGVSVRCTFNE